MSTPLDDVPFPNTRRQCFGPGARGLDADTRWLKTSPRDWHYIEGYRLAASAILESAQRNGGSPDFWLFPLTFTWRHHIELALKDLIWRGHAAVCVTREESAATTFDAPWGHGLLSLWERVMRLICELNGGGDALSEMQERLSEFERIDPRGMTFRYATMSGATDVSSANDLPDSVNLGSLHEAMTEVSNYLHCARESFNSRLEAMGYSTL